MEELSLRVIFTAKRVDDWLLYLHFLCFFLTQSSKVPFQLCVIVMANFSSSLVLTSMISFLRVIADPGEINVGNAFDFTRVNVAKDLAIFDSYMFQSSFHVLICFEG